MGSSISGRNIPLLPTSTHFLRIGWKAKISSEGCGAASDVDETRISRGLTHFCIGVVCRLKPDVLKTHFLEEDSHEPWTSASNQRTVSAGEPVIVFTDKISQSQPSVGHDALDLMELGQMGRVHRLVPEHTIYAEQLGRSESRRVYTAVGRGP